MGSEMCIRDSPYTAVVFTSWFKHKTPNSSSTNAACIVSNSNFTFCFLLSSKLSHIKSRPPARNQRVERGASPRVCPSSNPTLASVPSSQLPSQLVAMSSSQRQPYETRDKHIVYTEATTCVRTHSSRTKMRKRHTHNTSYTQDVITSQIQCSNTDRPLSYVSGCAQTRADDAPPWQPL